MQEYYANTWALKRAVQVARGGKAPRVYCGGVRKGVCECVCEREGVCVLWGRGWMGGRK